MRLAERVAYSGRDLQPWVVPQAKRTDFEPTTNRDVRIGIDRMHMRLAERVAYFVNDSLRASG